MARVKVKVDTRKLRGSLNKVTPALNKNVKKTLPRLIIAFIKKGISPVKGQGRLVKYSNSYKKSIQKGYVKNKTRPRPVNLTQTGDMLSSIRATGSARGGVTIKFTDEKADYHNNGTNKIPRRAMLPTETGEEFSKNITLRLREVVAKTITNILG
jgi:hypothetical protein